MSRSDECDHVAHLRHGRACRDHPRLSCGSSAKQGVGGRDKPGHDATYSRGRPMIPGEIITRPGDIELNKGRKTVTLTVANTGDRPIQVGSHYHFFETNPALKFERKKARGMRLDIPAGTAVRFEPGQTREVTLVAFAGARQVYGFRHDV